MAADENSTPSRAMVHYRSTALDSVKTSMGLARFPAGDVMKCPGVIAAAQMAEKAREQFKENKKHNAGVEEKGIGKAERYDRRTKLNRQSAAASRLRKEAYIQALEQQLLLHDDRNKALENDLREERASRIKLEEDLRTAATIAHVPAVPVTKEEDNLVTPKADSDVEIVNEVNEVSGPFALAPIPSTEVVPLNSGDAMAPYYLADGMADLGLDMEVVPPLEPFSFDFLDEGR